MMYKLQYMYTTVIISIFILQGHLKNDNILFTIYI